MKPPCSVLSEETSLPPLVVRCAAQVGIPIRIVSLRDDVLLRSRSHTECTLWRCCGAVVLLHMQPPSPLRPQPYDTRSTWLLLHHHHLLHLLLLPLLLHLLARISTSQSTPLSRASPFAHISTFSRNTKSIMAAAGTDILSTSLAFACFSASSRRFVCRRRCSIQRSSRRRHAITRYNRLPLIY